ncbi:hypothetical protein [Persephonella sp. KM09-Lau-8]|uniref:hypothetical protein n=1 Tax=Persephonella sp. KM09-Lau-8 TaxID=1158345 RepID=UPI000495E2ED|nr:hypothetical protein [Persephonella sp. KM09-Lau-8]
MYPNIPIEIKAVLGPTFIIGEDALPIFENKNIERLPTLKGKKDITPEINKQLEKYGIYTVKKEGKRKYLLIDSRNSRRYTYQVIKDELEEVLSAPFTIEAVALKSNGEIIDPLEGTKDIQEKKLKTVLEPDKLFSEKPWMAIKAIRYTSEGYKMESNLFLAVEQVFSKNNPLPANFFYKELKKNKGKEFIKLLHERGLLPELTSAYTVMQDPAINTPVELVFLSKRFEYLSILPFNSHEVEAVKILNILETIDEKTAIRILHNVRRVDYTAYKISAKIYRKYAQKEESILAEN